MSRTKELRLSGWVKKNDTLVNDLRFVELLEQKGALSYVIYDIMRGMIGDQNGYYAILNNSFILVIHRLLGRNSKGQAYIKAIIEYFGEIGILDKRLLKNNILTSADIQESWLIAKKAKRQRITENLEHWLLVDTLPSNYNDNCNNNSDSCTQDKTKHDSLLNDKLVINGNEDACAREDYTAETVLDIVLNKDTSGRALKAFNTHPQYEHYYKYAIYLANACNDVRLNKYGGDDYYINNDFFIAWIATITYQELFAVFGECYRRHSGIKASSAYYLRGIIYNKNKRLAIKHKKVLKPKGDRKMEREELERILANHKKWLNGESGEKANLRCADLRWADLRGVDLRCANLHGVDLRGANLHGVDLRGAYLCDADLRDANLSGANLYGADLRDANLSGANLQGAKLDFFCLPLRCGGLKWKTDKRLMAQLSYHFCSMECEDEEVKEAQNAILELANFTAEANAG